jgi:hypothetical protein
MSYLRSPDSGSKCDAGRQKSRYSPIAMQGESREMKAISSDRLQKGSAVNRSVVKNKTSTRLAAFDERDTVEPEDGEFIATHSVFRQTHASRHGRRLLKTIEREVKC